MDSARLGPVSDCTANRSALSSERVPYIKKKVIARHQDELAARPSVATSTSNFEQESVIGESSRQNSSSCWYVPSDKRKVFQKMELISAL
jgi:hypothetical protein